MFTLFHKEPPPFEWTRWKNCKKNLQKKVIARVAGVYEEKERFRLGLGGGGGKKLKEVSRVN